MDWDIYTLGSLSDQISYGFTNPMPTTANGPWMITAFDIADGYIRYEQARHTSERAYMHELTSKSRPIIGGLLITKDGTLGRVAIVDRKNICINQSVACVTLSPKADIGYLFHYLRSELAQRDMLAEAGGSTIKHIYITKLALMEIPVPPKSERNKIKDIMDYYETRFQAEERYRDKLKSIKKGLMNDLLTGKVRVWSEEH
jgi:type I restriction enzyme S subunit